MASVIEYVHNGLDAVYGRIGKRRHYRSVPYRLLFSHGVRRHDSPRNLAIAQRRNGGFPLYIGALPYTSVGGGHHRVLTRGIRKSSWVTFQDWRKRRKKAVFESDATPGHVDSQIESSGSWWNSSRTEAVVEAKQIAPNNAAASRERRRERQKPEKVWENRGVLPS